MVRYNCGNVIIPKRSVGINAKIITVMSSICLVSALMGIERPQKINIKLHQISMLRKVLFDQTLNSQRKNIEPTSFSKISHTEGIKT